MESLIKRVQARLGFDSQMTRMDKPQQLLQLVLLNYHPISRYQNGNKEYLYVDAYDAEGKVYYMRDRSIKRDASGKIAVEPWGLLEDALMYYSGNNDFVQEIALITGNKIVAGESPQNNSLVRTSDTSQIRYLRRNIELQALMFATTEFETFEKMALNSFNSNRIGRYFVGETMMANGREVKRSEWHQAAYNTFMLYRNIELTDYYYCNLKKPNSDMFFEMNRVCVFDEFIPLAYKFTDIFNPILDYDEELFSESKIFENAFNVEPLSMVGGSIFTISREARQTTSIYTTRLEMSNLFNVSVAKKSVAELNTANYLPVRIRKQFLDFFSPKYFLTVLYTQLITGSNMRYKFCLIPLDSNVFLHYEDDSWDVDDGAFYAFDSVAFKNILLDTPFRRKSLEISSKLKEKEISFIDSLYLEYLTHLYKAVNSQNAWTQKGIVADLGKD